MMTDLRYGIRQLIKNPGFTLIAVLTLALGIGANTAIFSVVNAVLLKPLPFPASEELVSVGAADAQHQMSPVSLNALSYPDFFDFRERNHTFANIAVRRDRAFALVGEQEAQSIRGQKVSAEFFDVLGVKPSLGRTFTRSDEQAGGGPGGQKVIISHAFWREHFDGRSNILGQTLLLDAQPYTVIGVMPAGFNFPIQTEGTDVYVTSAEDAISADGMMSMMAMRGGHGVDGIGRLKPGVTLAQAKADLETIAAALAKQYPESNANSGVALMPIREELVGDVRTALYVLLGAVVCVLLIANANVANLLLARASVRGKEIALRAALGASRGRIIRQLLTESLLLSGLAGLLGLLAANWATSALMAAVPQNIPRADTIHLDAAVLGFTLLISLSTGILCGLIPAWHASHVDLNSALKSGPRGAGSGERKLRVRNALVITEVALALVLLTCAGLLIQSFARLGKVQPGVEGEHLLTARVSLPDITYRGSESVVAFFDKLLAGIRAIPGVASASAIMPLPLSGSSIVLAFDIEEHPMPKGQQPESPTRMIDRDYFKTMGIPVLHGRGFEETDSLTSRPVVIVNERFAEKFFPEQNPIGKRIQPSRSVDKRGPLMRDIVGVVGNVKHRSLHTDFTPEIYLPFAQTPMNAPFVVVRTKLSNSAAVTSAVRAELAAIDGNIPLTRVRMFDQYLSQALARPRFNALLLSIFAATALLLTAIGIYGVLAYSVAQRTNEIGIRIALGAAKSTIFRLIVGQAMFLVAISVAVGLVGAFAATRLLNNLLYGIGASDPITFVGIVLLVTAVAFFAAWLPARRATRIDPIIALRAE
jgi:putative ABC transport system permease protein